MVAVVPAVFSLPWASVQAEPRLQSPAQYSAHSDGRREEAGGAATPLGVAERELRRESCLLQPNAANAECRGGMAAFGVTVILGRGAASVCGVGSAGGVDGGGSAMSANSASVAGAMETSAAAVRDGARGEQRATLRPGAAADDGSDAGGAEGNGRRGERGAAALRTDCAGGCAVGCRAPLSSPCAEDDGRGEQGPLRSDVQRRAAAGQQVDVGDVGAGTRSTGVMISTSAVGGGGGRAWVLDAEGAGDAVRATALLRCVSRHRPHQCGGRPCEHTATAAAGGASASVPRARTLR